MLELGMGNMHPYVQHTQDGQEKTEEWVSKALETLLNKLVSAVSAGKQLLGGKVVV